MRCVMFLEVYVTAFNVSVLAFGHTKRYIIGTHFNVSPSQCVVVDYIVIQFFSVPVCSSVTYALFIGSPVVEIESFVNLG